MHCLCVERRNKGIDHKNIFFKLGVDILAVGNLDVDKVSTLSTQILPQCFS
jgi:hypothetical protein